MDARQETTGTIIQIEDRHGAVLAVRGALDQSLAEPLLERVRSLVAAEPRLVMHLGEVDSADSAGLGALIRALKLARDAGGDLVLAQLSPSLVELFDQTGLDTVFRVFADTAEAVSAVLAA